MGNLKINSINFKKIIKWCREYDGDQWIEIPTVVVEVYIDNRSLTDLLKDYEKDLAKCVGHLESAGLYIGNSLSTDDYINRLKSFPVISEVGLLQCEECMSETCPYKLVFNIKSEGQYIYWFNFQQKEQHFSGYLPSGNRKNQHQLTMELKKDWNYKNFGPFIFDKQNYLTELEKLKESEFFEK